MANSISGVFQPDHARMVVEELKDRGYGDQVSLVAKDDRARGEVDEEGSIADTVGDASKGALQGGALGAILGMLAAVISVVLPGIGAVVVTGPLIASWGLTGGVLGALTGGLIGALTNIGIPEETAREYNERISRGDVLVVVDDVEDMDSQEVRSLFNEHQAENVAMWNS